MLNFTENEKSEIKNMVFFTIGGPRSEEVIGKADLKCRKLFPNYEKSIVIYFEGRFDVANTETDLFIKLTGTDLLRLNSLMAPEFI